MNNYNIIYSNPFKKDFSKLSDSVIREVACEILKLEKNPFFGPSIKKIKLSSKKDFRLRVGVSRIVYRVSGKTIYLLKVIHRKNSERILKELI